MAKISTRLYLEGEAAESHQRARRLRLEEMERLGVVQPSDHRLIPLLKGRFAKVDIEDFELLNESIWCVSDGYVRRRDRRIISIHRVIMDCAEHEEVDHVNRDRLDNRKANLRLCTKSQNQGNRWKPKNSKSSRYKGVHFCARERKFVARGRCNSVNKYIGLFKHERSAALAYNEWAEKHFGEFAFLNPV